MTTNVIRDIVVPVHSKCREKGDKKYKNPTLQVPVCKECGEKIKDGEVYELVIRKEAGKLKNIING